MKHEPALKAQKILHQMLTGTTLDSLRVYSVSMEIGFMHLPGTDRRPTEVWITGSGETRVISEISQVSVAALASENYFSLKADAIRALYLSIGKQVKDVALIGNSLAVQFEGLSILIRADASEHEESWCVADRPAHAVEEKAWYVGLDEQGGFISRCPS